MNNSQEQQTNKELLNEIIKQYLRKNLQVQVKTDSRGVKVSLVLDGDILDFDKDSWECERR